MKAIIELKTSTFWWKEYFETPFLMSVKNEEILTHYLIFLKELGCHDVLILKDGLEHRAIDSNLADGSLWGLSIQYAPLQDIARQDKREFYSYFIQDQECVLLKGLFFFDKRSIQKVGSNRFTIIDEEEACFKNEFISSFKRYYEKNIFGKNTLNHFSYTTKCQGPYIGNRTHIDQSCVIDEKSYIGHKTFLEKDCSIEERSVVGNKCFVGEKVKLNASVITDDTIVSKNLTFSNVVVGSDFVYDYNSDKVTKIEDENLFNTTKIFSISHVDSLFAALGILCLFPWKILKSPHRNSLLKSYFEVIKGQRELIGILPEDLKLIGFDEKKIKPAVFSFYPPNINEEMKIIHSYYYLGMRENMNRLSLIIDKMINHFFIEKD